MESLPSEIVQDIVSRVPAEYVLECKLVCKKWGGLIRQSNFTNIHLNHLHGGDDDGNDNLATKVESCLFFACRVDDPDVCKALLFHGGQLSDRIDEEVYIYHQNMKRIYHSPMHTDPISDHLVGSCMGLVCAYLLHNLVLDPIYICNPLTREYVHLPKLVVKKEDVNPSRIINGEVNMYYDVACGFGYSWATNEYKVVRVHYLKYYEQGNVEVYTLGSRCGWRAIGKVSYRLDSTRKGTGTYNNDAIYWISGNKVVAFDLAEEEFRLLSDPPCLQNRSVKDRCGLVQLGRHLCVYMDKSPMEIWSLKQGSSYSKETWCLEFDLDWKAVVGASSSSKFQPILLTKDGEIIFSHAKSVLYCYDKKTKNLKMISNKASTDCLRDVEAIPHVNTFASMGENSKRYTVTTPWVDDIALGELDRVALGEKTDTSRFRFSKDCFI